jgi:hypothetical protein
MLYLKMEAQLTSENCVSLTATKGNAENINLAEVPSSLYLMKIAISARGKAPLHQMEAVVSFTSRSPYLHGNIPGILCTGG